MKRLIPISLGVLVILVFSFWPIRLSNSICCLGVALGGLLGASYVGRSEGGQLDSALGIRLGASVGVAAALVTLLINLFIWPTAQGDAPTVDPVPGFMYSAILGVFHGIRDLASDAPGVMDPSGPGLVTRFVFQFFSNALFGAFGGAVAASLFREEPPVDRKRGDA